MKKLSLFILTLLFSATCVWADVSVTENFTQIASSGAINTTTTADGLTRGADVCSWLLTDIRWAGSNDKITIAQDKTINAMWLSLSTGGAGTIATTNLEGGLKKVEFKYARYGSEYNLSANPPVTGRSLRLKVSAGTDEQSTSAYDNNDLTSRTSGYQTFSHAFENKSNVQLSITNISTYTETLTNSGICRILVGDITITPYLLYTTKSANLDTRSSLTYTNNDLIDNTTGTAVEYSIAPTGSGATINSSTGQVTATDETKGDFTITATWGEVTTTYTLTIVSRTATTASFADAAKRVELDAQAIVNPLTYTDGYEGTIAYSSSNTAVATVNPSTGAVAFAGGVGQTTITATLPQTDNYKAASASYILYVEDNSASVQVEAFSEVPVGNAAAHMGQLWQGDVCEWRVSADGGVRKNSDKFASDQTRTGIWMGTPDPNTSYGSLTAENGVEGGIKHIWFYCEQPYNTGETGYTLKPVIYLNSAIEANKVGEVEVVGTSGADNIAANRQLFGASNVMKSNGVLIIRNESFKTDDGTRPAANSNRGRLLLDNIHITPYLLYTTKEATLNMQSMSPTLTYTNDDIVNNTTDAHEIEYSITNYGSLSEDSVSIDPATGQVSVVNRFQTGDITVQAKWGDVTTSYVLHFVGKDRINASFHDKVVLINDRDIPQNGQIVNSLTKAATAATPVFTSSNTEVATIANVGAGTLNLVGHGRTTITATIEEDEDCEGAVLSYELSVFHNGWIVESFDNVPATANYTTLTGDDSKQGDQCKWSVNLGGFNLTTTYTTGQTYDDNCARFKAPYDDDETTIAYIEGTKISGGIKNLSFQCKSGGNESKTNWDIHVYVNGVKQGASLTNLPKSDDAGWKTVTISDINVAGNFTIKFENHSTRTEAYTSGNRARLLIDNIAWENYDAPIVLDETADNSAILTVNNGETVDVNTNRSLVADVWNTLCLPFDIDKSDLGADVDVQVMSSAVIDGEDLTVGFRALSGNILAAGTPYLVKPTLAVSLTGFTDKQITATPGTITQGSVTLTGIFSPKELTAGDKTTLFVGTPNGEGNNLFYPGETGDLNGMRAYFKISTPSGAPTLRRARFIVNEAQSPTALDEADNALQSSRKVLENGHLFIIRDGKKYNVTGQKIQ